MLFHIIKIPKNSSKSPQWMLPGHIFLLTQHGEVSPCCGRRTMGSVGQNPRGSSRAASLPFLCTFWQVVLFSPPTSSKTICCWVSPPQLPQHLGVFFFFFFLFGCSVFHAAPSKLLPQPWLAGRREAGKGFAHTSSSAWLQEGEVLLVKGLLGWVNHPLLLLPLKYCWN